MADDVIETLAKLKPVAPNRDAILFAAGRASVRRAQWKLLLAGLVLQQCILLWLWTSPKEPGEIRYLKSNIVDEPTREAQPAIPEMPSAAPGQPSLLNLDPKSTDPIPTASTIPEQHWTIRTTLSDL